MNLIVTDLASREAASIKSGAAHEIEFVIGGLRPWESPCSRASPIGVLRNPVLARQPERWSRIWRQASRTAGLS